MVKKSKSKKPQFAGLRIRFLAMIIDSVITLPFILVLGYLFGVDEYVRVAVDEDFYFNSPVDQASESNKVLDIISWVIAIAYSVFFVSSAKQATPGKMICKIYVADVNGNKLTKSKATMRFFGSILSVLTFGIGVLMIAFTKEKTSLHDLICSTRVFRGKVK